MSTDGQGIYGDIMVYYIEESFEWCAAYMPQQLYGYGKSRQDALLALQAALRFRRDELNGYIDEMGAPMSKGAIVVDLNRYRRHKAAHAIQTPQPDGEA